MSNSFKLPDFAISNSKLISWKECVENIKLKRLFSFEEQIIFDKLYLQSNNSIPSVKCYHNIDAESIFNALHEKYGISNEQIFSISNVHPETKEKNFYLSETGILLRKNLMLHFKHHLHRTTIYFDSTTDVDLMNELQEILFSSVRIRESKKTYLGLIGKNYEGLSISNFEMNMDNAININKHYNPDFEKVHERIISKLSEPKSKGIVLLHGKPGTGKTTYIRHLIAQLDKPKIYLPTDLSHHLASPDFLSFLQEQSNSILIIEDAENIIQQRHGGGSGAIANLLNLTDGLLSDVLNIQIVCTFNTSISKIDSALLRKGRLIASYCFEELNIEKSQQLVNENELNFEVTQPMTLAEIFNHVPEEKNVLDVSHLNGNTPIGFRMQPIPSNDDYLLPSHKI